MVKGIRKNICDRFVPRVLRAYVVLLQRPTKRASQLLFAVTIVLPFVAADVYACTCRERQPPCSQYASADVVFSGLVKKITSDESNFRQTISFNVEKAFKGVSGTVVELADSRSSCSAEFEEGEKYLVYAYRTKDGKELYTHYCTRTTELSKADDDLVYLNSLSKNPQPTEIVGRLTHFDKKLRRISVVVTSGGATYRTVSDENGWFRVKVPAGRYRVRMLLPLYTFISGTADELAPITGHKVTKRGIAVDYDLSVETGECSFVDLPLFIENDEYEKHRGLNPQPLTNKRQR